MRQQKIVHWMALVSFTMVQLTWANGEPFGYLHPPSSMYGDGTEEGESITDEGQGAEIPAEVPGTETEIKTPTPQRGLKAWMGVMMDMISPLIKGDREFKKRYMKDADPGTPRFIVEDYYYYEEGWREDLLKAFGWSSLASSLYLMIYSMLAEPGAIGSMTDIAIVLLDALLTGLVSTQLIIPLIPPLSISIRDFPLIRFLSQRPRFSSIKLSLDALQRFFQADEEERAIMKEAINNHLRKSDPRTNQRLLRYLVNGVKRCDSNRVEEMGHLGELILYFVELSPDDQKITDEILDMIEPWLQRKKKVAGWVESEKIFRDWDLIRQWAIELTELLRDHAFDKGYTQLAERAKMMLTEQLGTEDEQGVREIIHRALGLTPEGEAPVEGGAIRTLPAAEQLSEQAL